MYSENIYQIEDHMREDTTYIFTGNIHIDTMGCFYEWIKLSLEYSGRFYDHYFLFHEIQYILGV